MCGCKRKGKTKDDCASFGACTIRWELMSLNASGDPGGRDQFCSHINPNMPTISPRQYAKIAVEYVSGSPEDRLELVINT